MRDDDRFEISRAFDLLPHVAGASWAATWFRMSGQKNPSADQFRAKVVEFFDTMDSLFQSLPRDGAFADISKYIESRRAKERENILSGDNSEIEKRHRRYLDYG